MQHFEGNFSGATNTQLFYQRWRPDGAPHATLAIVHGFGEHSARYMNVVNALVPRGYAVSGFDLRGHGRSPGQRGYINAWAEYREDTAAFLKLVTEQEPSRPLFLMGHSMGGLIALEYGLHRPEGLRGVIASAPLLAQPGISPVLLTLSRILSRVYPTFSLNTGLDATAISRDPNVVKAYTEDSLVHSLGTPRLGTEITAAQNWVLAHAAELRVPLLVFFGTADRLAPPEGTRRFYDRVTVADKQKIEYEGAFHETHNDIIADQVMANLTRWLDAHLK